MWLTGWLGLRDWVGIGDSDFDGCISLSPSAYQETAKKKRASRPTLSHSKELHLSSRLQLQHAPAHFFLSASLRFATYIFQLISKGNFCIHIQTLFVALRHRQGRICIEQVTVKVESGLQTAI